MTRTDSRPGTTTAPAASGDSEDVRDEAGTAPEDRRFRPDVHGLRAIAIILVVLFHAGISGFTGGYVGVDVFFVISGFVITGVLLRERVASGRTSMLRFYARRCRRIIPAATLVILVTVVLAFVFLGDLAGVRTAVDGRWASVFFVNFHFASEGTNYLASQQPPSALQNFWSLSVEEQFYLVYPTLFLLIAAFLPRASLRARLGIGLGAIIVASYAWSVVQTSSNPVVAYFSPFTRAWELALGGLVAVGTRWCSRIPALIAAAMTWCGLGAILVSSLVFGANTAYPGSLVAIPVVGAALVIAGGAPAPRLGAESLLSTRPFHHLGNWSYSLYLWHWPILIVAAESEGKTILGVWQNVGLIAVAVLASTLSYRLLENPVRHSRWLAAAPRRSVLLGVGLVVLTLLATTVFIRSHPTSPDTSVTAHGIPGGTAAQVQHAVAESNRIERLSANLTPRLLAAPADIGWPPARCAPTLRQVAIPSCIFGDVHGKRTMVLYGDSHALMWFQAVDDIAIQDHWRLAIVAKGFCMADKYPSGSLPILLAVCRNWQDFAFQRIKQIHPSLVLITQEVQHGPGEQFYTPAQWAQGLSNTLRDLSRPGTKFVVLGNIPGADASPLDCLAQHPTQVQLCSTAPPRFDPYDEAEDSAVTAAGGHYIGVTPWFCSQRCSPVISHYIVYFNQLHLTKAYSLFLRQVLAERLALQQY